jgi:hypothetical protein
MYTTSVALYMFTVNLQFDAKDVSSRSMLSRLTDDNQYDEFGYQ